MFLFDFPLKLSWLFAYPLLSQKTVLSSQGRLFFLLSTLDAYLPEDLALSSLVCICLPFSIAFFYSPYEYVEVSSFKNSTRFSGFCYYRNILSHLFTPWNFSKERRCDAHPPSSVHTLALLLKLLSWRLSIIPDFSKQWHLSLQIFALTRFVIPFSRNFFLPPVALRGGPPSGTSPRIPFLRWLPQRDTLCPLLCPSFI